MKVKLNHSVGSFSGHFKADKLIYWTVKRTGLCFGRAYAEPKLVENHHRFGQVNNNLTNFYHNISPDYKRDLAAYTAFYKTEFVGMGDRVPTVFGFYKKMMYALGKRFPEIDLATLTIEDVVMREYPIVTIAEAMKSDLLPKVDTYGELGNKISL
ncbi:MAG TPA: hypothetical protein PLE74_02560 [Candidatus Cloacimonadota bacterium]|nr:hypothetical protein [Candidatus Cloacimonadota bacterium]HPT71145.1 hypothetical protein [Candidatus Cloacimonadota bacterium]